MTLLELFVKNKAPGERMPTIGEYVVWLEALTYQLIRERQETLQAVKDLPKNDTQVENLLGFRSLPLSTLRPDSLN
jgi:hypothetical protein